MLKVYMYKNCGTCQKAKKYLAARDVDYTEIAIRDVPPTKAELKRMLKYFDGSIRKLFNTSGMDYKSGNYKDKLPEMSDAQAIDALNANGNLVKRPFLIGKDFGTVGFKEDVWDDLLG
jgi:arsenate reductase